MTIGSLFSGVGGLELGLERAGLGPTLWQVEIDPFRRSVLAKHWPATERHEDVRTVGAANLALVDLVCGGFPCKDVSSAGKRAGLAGPQSGLWYELARIVEEMLPRVVVIENVTSGAAAWVDLVRGDLERIGYASLPIPIAARDCGAFHRRARVFIVAHLDGAGLRLESGRRVGQGRDGSPFADESGPQRHAANDDGEHGDQGRDVRESHPTWAAGAFAQPDVVRVVHGLSKRVDASRRRALGDSVVPQQAEVIGQVIRLLCVGE